MTNNTRKQQQGNFMFNTTRFIDVTTNRQRSNGTTIFLDSDNPGVYYGSYQSGYVRRIVATQNTQSDLNTGKTTQWNSDNIYQINRRCHFTEGNGITSVLLPRSNDRLSRIQEMANKFDRENEIITHTNDNFSIIISPRLR
mgnify:CR=1 FL=1